MVCPLFSIPTHQFLFYPGQCNPRDFQDALQVEEAEFALIRYPGEAPAYTAVAMSGIFCRSSPRHIRRRCLAQREAGNECHRGGGTEKVGSDRFDR